MYIRIEILADSNLFKYLKAIKCAENCGDTPDFFKSREYTI